MNRAIKSVHLRYFAILREQRGLASEAVETNAPTAKDLYEELQKTHGFKLNCNNLRVAVNDRFVNWSEELKNNDTVVFLPPVSGG
jgi:molybdopterin converting factor subunit 1